MDIAEISMLSRAAAPGMRAVDPEDAQRRQVAKNFEGVFVRQIMDRMKETVDEFEADDEEKDGSTEQIKGIFWSFLGDAVAENGGFGLWEHIYKSMPDGGLPQNGSKLDESA